MDSDGRIGKGLIIGNSRTNKGETECFGIVNKSERGMKGCQDLKGYPSW
jgi:hypothetical protein